PTRDEAHDLVTGHRRTTSGQPDHHVVKTLDVDTGRRLAPAGCTSGDGQLFLGVAGAQLARDTLGDGLCRDVVLTDGDVERVEIGVGHRVGDVGQHGAGQQLLYRQALAPQRSCELVLAGLQRILAALPREPLANLV